MTKASDNPYPSILITEGTEPSAPAAGKQRLYIDSTSHHLKRTDSSGTDVDIESAAANGLATDTLWDAAGDLVVGSGSNTAAKLSIGSVNGMSLRRVSGAVAWDYPPGYEWDYVAVSSGSVSVTGTSEAGAQTLVTSNAFTPDGGAVMIEFFAPAARADNSASNRNLSIFIHDSVAGAGIGIVCLFTGPAAVSDNKPAWGRLRTTLTAAAHTLTAKAFVNAGTGSVGNGAGGANTQVPMYLRVTKV